MDANDSVLRGAGPTTELLLAATPKSSLVLDADSEQATVMLEDVTSFQEHQEVIISDGNHFGKYTIQSVDNKNSGLVFTSNLTSSYRVADNALVVVDGYAAFTIDGQSIEVYGFAVYGNRENRSGGIELLWNGLHDGSWVTPPDAGYADGTIIIGHHSDSENITIHDLYITNSSSHAIGVYAKNGHFLDDIIIRNNSIVDSGDKAIVVRYYDDEEGVIGHVEILGNLIDGTGKANLNDGSDGKFSWGDGIQLHHLAPRSAVVANNTVNDTARSGIWVMWSDNHTGEVIISNNIVTNWGQKTFGNENLIHVSGIHVNRGLIRITDNFLYGGFTPDNPRLGESFGIYLYAGTKFGGKDREQVHISGNIIDGYYNATTETAGIYLGLCKKVMVADNIIRGGRNTVIKLNQVSDVDIVGNTVTGLNLLLGHSHIFDIRVENNDFKEMIKGDGKYQNIVIVPPSSK